MAITQVRIQPQYARSNIPGAQPLLRGDPNQTAFGVAEDSSQTWGIGDLIYHDRSDEGLLKICTIATEIAGQANRAAVGTKNTYVHFRPILPTDEYIMNVYHTTVGSAVTSLTQRGAFYALALVSGKWLVDIETPVEQGSDAVARVKVVGFAEKNPMSLAPCVIGDTYGLVRVTFLPFSIANDGNPFQRILQYC